MRGGERDAEVQLPEVDPCRVRLHDKLVGEPAALDACGPCGQQQGEGTDVPVRVV